MEDLLIFRRQRATTGQWKSHEKPLIKIEQEKSVYLEVLTTPNEKGMFKVVPSL